MTARGGTNRTSPTGDDTCHSVAAGTDSDALTGLAPTVAYTYGAYDVPGCNSADELATVTYTMPGVSVSNLNETTNSSISIYGSVLEAAGFTTGDNSGGYTLWSVTGAFAGSYGNPGDIIVAIHAESGGNPAATATYTLRGDNPGAQDGQYEFTCSGDCTLDADTTYFLVMSGTSPDFFTGTFAWNHTDSDDQTNTPGDAGWTIADVAKWGHNDVWSDESEGWVTLFKVTAIPNPSLDASGVTATTATLTLSNHNGAWWYERTSPVGDATCQSVAAGAKTASLSSLTAGTSYTYKAYDKSGCNSADELATVTFTTPAS